MRVFACGAAASGGVPGVMLAECGVSLAERSGLAIMHNTGRMNAGAAAAAVVVVLVRDDRGSIGTAGKYIFAIHIILLMDGVGFCAEFEKRLRPTAF